MTTEIATLTQTPATTTLTRFNNNNHWVEPSAARTNSSFSLKNSPRSERSDTLKSTSATLSHYNAIFSDDDDDDSPPQVLCNYYSTVDNRLPFPTSNTLLNKQLNSNSTTRKTTISYTGTNSAADNHTVYQSWPKTADSALKTAASYHTHQADTALETLKRIILEEDWKKVLKHKSGVIVHMKTGIDKDDKTPTFKGEAVIQGFSPQSIFYVIGMRKLWDEQYEDGNLIENLNDTTSLTYEAMKPTATNKSRDFALVEKIECTQKGSIVFACTSVETPRIPRVSGRTRANIKLQGWILEPLYGGPRPATKVIYVIQESMKGWVPGFAKKTLARRPLVIAKVAEYLEKKTNRTRAQQQQSNKSGATSSFLQSLTGGRSRRPSILSNKNNSSSPLAPSLPSPLSPPLSLSKYNSSTSILLQSSTSLSSGTPRQRSKKGTLLSQQQQSQQQALLNSTSPMVQSLTAHNSSDKRHISFAPHTLTYEANSNMSGQPTEQIEEANSSTEQPLSNVTGYVDEPPTNAAIEKSTSVQVKQSTRGLYASHRHPIQKVESLQLLKRLSLTTDDWSLAKELSDGSKQYVFNSHIPSSEEEDDLTSLIHDYTSSADNDIIRANATPPRSTRRLSFIRVDGIIEGKWTAEQLCSVVRNFGARKTWDLTFEEGCTIDRFSQKDYLEQWKLKHVGTHASTTHAPIDLAIITSLETDPVTGTVYAASTSVEDSQIPFHQYIRGHTDLYGWVFRPQPEKDEPHTGSSNTASSVHVSFIYNMNFRNYFPNQVLQAWIEASYRSINQLKAYLSHYGCPPYIRRVAGKVVQEEYDPLTKHYQIRFIAKHQPSKSYRQRKERQYQRQNSDSSNNKSMTGSLWCTDIRFDRQLYPHGVDITVTPAKFTHIEVSTKSHKSVKIVTTDAAIEGGEVMFTMQPLGHLDDSSNEPELHVPAFSRYRYNGTLFPLPKHRKEVLDNSTTTVEQVDANTTFETSLNSTMVNPSISRIDKYRASAKVMEKIADEKENTREGLLAHYQDSEHSKERPLTGGRQIEREMEQTGAKEPFDPVKIPKGYVLVPEQQSNNIIMMTDELSFNGQQLSLIFLAMVLCYYMGKFSACTATSY